MTDVPAIDEVRGRWPEIVQAVGDVNARIGALLGNGEPDRFDDRTLVVITRYPVHAYMPNRHPEAVERALADVFGGVCGLRFEASTFAAPVGAGSNTGEIHLVYPVTFSESEDVRLTAEAARRGVEPTDLIRRLTLDGLPPE